MTTNDTDKSTEGNAFNAMWRGWALTAGASTGIAVASLWVAKLWLPIVAFTFGILLYTMVRRNREAPNPKCYVVPFLGIYVLMWSGTVMAAIDIWHSPTLFPGNSPAHVLPDGTVPYLGALIVYPLAALFALWGSVMKYKLPFCVDCRMRLGDPVERGFMGLVYCQEGLFQRRLMFSLSLFQSAVCWAYYLFVYDPEAISSTDIWFFAVFPVVVYVASTVYLAVRYSAMWFYYDRDFEGSSLRHGMSTTVRYIIIAGNEIFLRKPDPDAELMPTDDRTDTPAKCTISYRRKVSHMDAVDWFLNILRLPSADGLDIRMMYESRSASARCNMFHYFVFADSRELIENSHINGEWYTIFQIKELIDTNGCNSLLAAEIHRLHTIAMAWKTYDRQGRRLYKIKHYTPTFRVADIRKWDVDYNDSHWLFVAQNNEDRPFYRLRRLWRRYISGIND